MRKYLRNINCSTDRAVEMIEQQLRAEDDAEITVRQAPAGHDVEIVR